MVASPATKFIRDIEAPETVDADQSRNAAIDLHMCWFSRLVLRPS